MSSGSCGFLIFFDPPLFSSSPAPERETNFLEGDRVLGGENQGQKEGEIKTSQTHWKLASQNKELFRNQRTASDT